MQVYVIDVASGATQEMDTARNDRDLAGLFSILPVPLLIVILSTLKLRRLSMYDEDDDDAHDEIICIVLACIWAVMVAVLLFFQPTT